MNLVILLTLAPILAVLIATVVSIPLTLLDVWVEWDEKRIQRKKLKYSIQAWKKIALEKHPVNDAVERGYAVARMLNCMHELKLLSGKGWSE